MGEILAIISHSIVLIIVIFMFIFMRKVTGKIVDSIVFSLLTILTVVSYQLVLMPASIIFAVILVSYFTSFLIRFYSKIQKSFNKNKNVKSQTVSSNKEIYEIVEDAVLGLSASKTGALITFEKNENLDTFIVKGKKVNAPISSELLRTIFYPGTPLHDGAVIVRGNTIEAASVFFTPTTRAMSGKFGARHRAAIGFSENQSSVTVVVSEETGRVSIAYEGEIISCNRDNFKERFEDIMKK